MGQSRNVMGVLNVRSHLYGLFGGAACGSISYADEIRTQLCNGIYSFKHAAERCVFLGRENFTREQNLSVALLQQIFDLQTTSHLSTRE